MTLTVSQIFSEMIGTLLLVLLGNGACFSVNHSKMFANQPGKWIVVVLGWGFGLFVGAIAATAMGGPGHLNPAVSIFASFKDAQVLIFIPMQFLGAMIAEIILYLINWSFIKNEAELVDGDKTATRGSSCTNPAFDGKRNYLTNFGSEFVGTMVLIMMIFVLTYHSNQIGSLNSAATIGCVTAAIMGVGFSLGSSTGFALNPARDLGPRIVYQLLILTKTGKPLVNANWQYSWIPVFAPICAGLIFGLITLAY